MVPKYNNAEEDQGRVGISPAHRKAHGDAASAQDWQSPQASVGDAFMTPAARQPPPDGREVQMTPSTVHGEVGPPMAFTASAAAPPRHPTPAAAASAARKPPAAKAGAGRSKKEVGATAPSAAAAAAANALVCPVDASTRADLVARVAREVDTLVRVAELQRPVPMGQVDLSTAATVPAAVQLKCQVAALLEGRSEPWEVVAADIRDRLATDLGPLTTESPAPAAPSLAAVKNCVIDIAKRVYHHAPVPGSEEPDILNDVDEDRIWLWQVKDLKLLALCGGDTIGNDVKAAAADSRLWFSKLKARLEKLADVAAALTAAAAAASTRDPTAGPGDTDTTLRLAVAAANKTDGLDRINVAIATRRHKRQGKGSIDAARDETATAVHPPKCADDYAAIAADAEAAAAAALADITDPAQCAAAAADALRPKATTSVGRKLKAAENARARAEVEAGKERAKAAKDAEKEATGAAKEADRVAKESAKEADRVAKESAKDADRVAKEGERKAKEEDKAAAAAEKEKARLASLEEKEQAKLAKEREKDEARVAKEEEREAQRQAGMAKSLKAQAKAKEQSKAFKNFFAAAPQASAAPAAAVLTKP